jgi:hypothetical protein
MGEDVEIVKGSKAKFVPAHRAKDGKFLPGHKYGKGNPWLGEIAKIRKRLFESVKADDWDAIRDALITKSKEGDIKAMTLLFSYVLGKPVQVVEANVNAVQMTAEQAQQRVLEFFHADEETDGSDD